MRSYFLALALALAIFSGVFGYSHFQAQRLHGFCTNLTLGTDIAKVREMAQQQGFDALMDPHAQMRIELTGAHISPPKCRVFFNPERNVEYRIWQESG